jgi:hypothetical protein
MDRTKPREDWQELMTLTPYGCLKINQADVAAVLNVLRSHFWTQAPAESVLKLGFIFT